jgi:hypothetical protein
MSIKYGMSNAPFGVHLSTRAVEILFKQKAWLKGEIK